MKVISLLMIVLAAGVYWWGNQARDMDERTAVGSTMCFDEALADKVRLEGCGRAFAVGGESAGEALDTQLMLYAKIKNFEDGRRAVNAALDAGLTAPRWLFWQAYFNTKRNIDQPPIIELIERITPQVENKKDFARFLLVSEDKVYIRETLINLSDKYNQELWWQYANAISLQYQRKYKDSLIALSTLAQKYPKDHDIFIDFHGACFVNKNICPKLELVPMSQVQALSCEGALEWFWTYKNKRSIDPKSGLSLSEIYQNPNLAWLYAVTEYLDAFSKVVDSYDKEAFISLIPILEIISCREDDYKKSDTFYTPAFEQFSDDVSEVVQHNIKQYAYYIKNNIGL